MPYDARYTRQGLSALFDLKGAMPDVRSWCGEAVPDFPATPNTRTEKDGRSLWFIGPNHWILRAPIEEEGHLDADLRPTEAPAEVSVVRISDTLTFFSVEGADAAQVMAVACPLDLHPSVFGPDAVTYTEVFGLKALVMQKGAGFEFAVEQSFGDMIDDYLTRALD
ncbi:MAG: sarcosine oxidase subunit gamma [Rhodobacteraceae bacterium]|nr:sarcosine oxidase subunit gamma [Paracoccaceae bacterium]